MAQVNKRRSIFVFENKCVSSVNAAEIAKSTPVRNVYGVLNSIYWIVGTYPHRLASVD
jgi:hypothetical protein